MDVYEFDFVDKVIFEFDSVNVDVIPVEYLENPAFYFPAVDYLCDFVNGLSPCRNDHVPGHSRDNVAFQYRIFLPGGDFRVCFYEFRSSGLYRGAAGEKCNKKN